MTIKKILLAILIILVIGVIIPFLFIRNNKALSEKDIKCANLENNLILNNPIENMLILKTVAIGRSDYYPDTIISRAYTIFGIPYAEVTTICDVKTVVRWRLYSRLVYGEINDFPSVPDKNTYQTQIENYIKSELENNYELTILANAQIDKMPPGTHNNQIIFKNQDNQPSVYIFEEKENLSNLAFLSIFRGNTNYNIPNSTESGIWARIGRGRWQQILDASALAGTTTIRFNPVGMFVKDKKLFVDLADDRGAGSGEGNLLRYYTTDGREWTRENCYYFIPDNYYVNGFDLKGLVRDPWSLTKNTCPN
ncbi:MAG TPA: hypothetical protein DEB09_02150 [Candidatus Magasanikbacteria bacterium]|nr:hypothetical protein [Candidatus Magasanikbacteria bacterium]